MVLRLLEIVYRFLLNVRFAQAVRSTVPVIVVGNITVGGTGKSPLVAYIAQLLCAQGMQVAIIMRGYKGTHKGTVKVTNQHTAVEVGDEACMLRQMLDTSIDIVVDSNRARALLFASTQLNSNIVVSDDGLQNKRLWRDMSLITVDSMRMFGNGHLLPAGPLRSPVTQLQQASALLFSGTNDVPHPLPEARLVPKYRMLLQPTALVDLATNLHWSFAEWNIKHQGKQVYAFAAIGNPARFFATLRACDIQCNQHAFADHYTFNPHDMPNDERNLIVMTHKDAVKCTFATTPERFFYLRTQLVITPEGHRQDFAPFLLDTIGKCRSINDV